MCYVPDSILNHRITQVKQHYHYYKTVFNLTMRHLQSQIECGHRYEKVYFKERECRRRHLNFPCRYQKSLMEDIMVLLFDWRLDILDNWQENKEKSRKSENIWTWKKKKRFFSQEDSSDLWVNWVQNQAFWIKTQMFFLMQDTYILKYAY